MTNAPVYYHGGVPDKLPGQLLLPPEKTGAISTAIYGASGVCNVSKVYITTDLSAAVLFASGHPSGRGSVYRVTPNGDIAHDPDCRIKGLSFECQSATVISRVRIKNKIMMRARKALHNFAESG